MVETSAQITQNQDLAKLKAEFESLTSKKEFKVELDPDTLTTPRDDFYECLICLDIIWDAQSCDECERSFCRECIVSWLKNNLTCPNPQC